MCRESNSGTLVESLESQLKCFDCSKYSTTGYSSTYTIFIAYVNNCVCSKKRGDTDKKK